MVVTEAERIFVTCNARLQPYKMEGGEKQTNKQNENQHYWKFQELLLNKAIQYHQNL
jgi:hypothetical protein